MNISERETPYGGNGGNGGGEPTLDAEELVRETINRVCKETGLTGVTVSVKLDHSTAPAAQKKRDPSSPKQAREMLEEHEREEDDLITAAATLEHAAKRDLGLAARVLSKGESATDFLRRVHPSESSLLESGAKCRTEDSLIPKAIAWGTLMAVGTYLGGLAIGYNACKKNYSVKGLALKWLLKKLG